MSEREREEREPETATADSFRPRFLVIDIETRADNRLWDDPDYCRRVYDRIEAPSNYKDAAKIESYRGEQFDSKRNSAALRPTHGKIVCIGWMGLYGDDAAETVCDLDHERVVLTAFLGAIGRGPWRLAGHNIREFDLPFLAARCAIHGVELPRWWPRPRDWGNVLDTVDHMGRHSLADWCAAFGLPPKLDDNGGLDLPADELAAYCAADVDRTAHILGRLYHVR